MGLPARPQSHASDLERVGVLAALQSALRPVVHNNLPTAISELTEKMIDNGDHDAGLLGNEIWLAYDGILRAAILAIEHAMDLLEQGHDHGLQERYDALRQIFGNEEP